jgi:hypothetical protein
MGYVRVPVNPQFGTKNFSNHIKILLLLLARGLILNKILHMLLSINFLKDLGIFQITEKKSLGHFLQSILVLNKSFFYYLDKDTILF